MQHVPVGGGMFESGLFVFLFLFASHDAVPPLVPLKEREREREI